MKSITYDKEKAPINVARLKKGGMAFEVVIKDPETANRFKKGEELDLHDFLEAYHIFDDASRATRPDIKHLQQIFNTTDELEIAKQIIKEGEIQLTQDYRKKLADEKERKIITKILLMAKDSRSNLPIPETRIKLAFEQEKIHLDPLESVDRQFEEVIEKLRKVLPISLEEIELSAKIPAWCAMKAYSSAKSKYKILDEIWNPDGSVTLKISLYAGQKSELLTLLNSISKGETIIE